MILVEHNKVKIFIRIKSQAKDLRKKEAKKWKHQEKATTTDAPQAKLMEDHHPFHLMKFGVS